MTGKLGFSILLAGVASLGVEVRAQSGLDRLSSAEARVIERLLGAASGDAIAIDGSIDAGDRAALSALFEGAPDLRAIEAENGLIAALIAAGAARDAERRAEPAQIRTTQPRESPPGAALAPDALFARAAPAVHRVRAYRRHPTLAPRQLASIGSAVAIAPRLALTNCHVIGQSAHIFLRAPNGVLRRARALERHGGASDACALEIDDGAPFEAIAETGDGASLRIGQQVYAIGAPAGLDVTLSAGLISGLRDRRGERWVQTDAAISRGSSGGGLFDDRGRLIAITTAFVEEGQNLNFALPIDAYRDLLPDMRGGAP